MKADIDGTKLTAANFAFSAFLFSVFGWALIEAALFDVAAGFRLHLLATLWSLGVSTVALRRCRRCWSLFADMAASVNRSASSRYRISDVTSSVALFAAGSVLAYSAKTGSLAIFAICAGAFNLVPWSRLVFCRRHFFTSCAILGAGAASIFIVTRPTAAFIYYLLWAWFLEMYALVALLTTWTSNRPAILRPRPVLGAELKNPEQAADPQLEKA